MNAEKQVSWVDEFGKCIQSELKPKPLTEWQVEEQRREAEAAESAEIAASAAKAAAQLEKKDKGSKVIYSSTTAIINTECPKIYLKSVLHLLIYTANLY